MDVTEKRFKGRVAVVTGGAKGIGRGCVEAFLKEGASVAVISRTQSELEKMKEDLGVGDHLYIQCGDISEEKTVKGFFENAEKKLGPVNYLVNNAAVVKSDLVTDMNVADWDLVMAVNVRAVFLCTKELFNLVKKKPRIASIVNISSLAGIRATDKFPGFTSYSASKFAVIGITECTASEGRTLGVRVNCIAPGAVDTELLRRAAPHLKTQTKPEDIAKSVLFLLDENQSGKMSGSTLEIYSNIQ